MPGCGALVSNGENSCSCHLALLRCLHDLPLTTINRGNALSKSWRSISARSGPRGGPTGAFRFIDTYQCDVCGAKTIVYMIAEHDRPCNGPVRIRFRGELKSVMRNAGLTRLLGWMMPVDRGEGSGTGPQSIPCTRGGRGGDRVLVLGLPSGPPGAALPSSAEIHGGTGALHRGRHGLGGGTAVTSWEHRPTFSRADWIWARYETESMEGSRLTTADAVPVATLRGPLRIAGRFRSRGNRRWSRCFTKSSCIHASGQGPVSRGGPGFAVAMGTKPPSRLLACGAWGELKRWAVLAAAVRPVAGGGPSWRDAGWGRRRSRPWWT